MYTTDRAQTRFKMLSTKHPYKLYIYIYIYIKDMVLNYLQWLICHKTQPNKFPLTIFNKKIIFFSTKVTKMLLFLMKHYIIKINIPWFKNMFSIISRIRMIEISAWIPHKITIFFVNLEHLKCIAPIRLSRVSWKYTCSNRIPADTESRE